MWATRFRIRQYLRTSLWVAPLLGGLAGVFFGSIGVLVDKEVSLPPYWQYSPATASTVLTAIVGAMVALLGFVVTVSVLGVQMTTGTFSPRYMRLWYRDRTLKTMLSLLVGTITFSFALLRRVADNFVPNLGVTAAGLLVFASVFLFVVFFGRFLHRLRPVAVAALVARTGREVFAAAVREAASPDAPQLTTRRFPEVGPPLLDVRNRTAGSIQAVDGRGLVRWARQHDCLLALPNSVGDFVAADSTLIAVYGVGELGPLEARQLRGMVALGIERTTEQDPAFAIRVMVDIANKALSAAINDPTTAVQVLDHLGETLRVIGTAELRGQDPAPGTSTTGIVLMRARRWEDFLTLALTEIREYGAQSMQVNRRLRALLEELLAEVRPENRAAVEAQLARLDASIATHFGSSPNLDQASAADRQGLGGASLDDDDHASPDQLSAGRHASAQAS